MVLGLALVMALVFGVATTALSATGGNFILGQANVAKTASKLTANVAAPALTLVNNSTAAAATALNITVPAGKAPLKVNATAGKATNLDADKLDGKGAEDFYAAGSKVADADTVDGLSSEQLRGVRAYARVINTTSSAPTLDLTRTSGFTAVSRASDGTYCLTPASGIDPANRPAVASVEWQSTSHPEGNAAAMPRSHDAPFPGCPNGAFEVVTERQSVVNSVLEAVPANDIGFTIIVP